VIASNSASTTRSRLIAATVVSTAVFSSVLATPASAAPRTTRVVAPNVHGLFGAQDPTYDGVFRQGLSILALRAAQIPVPTIAVNWLLGQQCADGGFQPYRPTATACLKSDPVNFRGEDTNSTALAVAALSYVWRTSSASSTLARLHARARAIAWLAARQNRDGGWAYIPGSASDANSTGIVLASFNAAGVESATRHRVGGSNALHFLNSIQLKCWAGVARGGLDYQVHRPLKPNGSATAQALWGLTSGGIVAPRVVSVGVLPTTCLNGTWPKGVTVAEAGAAYLNQTLLLNHGMVPSPFGSGADPTTTAFAVLSMVGTGRGAVALGAAIRGLRLATPSYVRDSQKRSRPASLALLILAAHATRASITNFGGVNLGARLLGCLTK
jgi:hypothetical protein